MLENLKQSLGELFSPLPQKQNIFNITTQDKVYQDGYFFVELENEKVILNGQLKIMLLDEEDPHFCKGLENYLETDGERRQISRKYIKALNQMFSTHITPFLREPNFDVSGDGEPDWTVIFKKDITEAVNKCEKNRDLIMLLADEIEKTSFALTYRDNQRYYAGTKSNMMKEAKEKDREEKLQKQQPKPQAEVKQADTSAAPTLKVKIFSNSDKTALENEFNQWFSERPELDLNGLECKTCSVNDKIENSIFVLYK